MEESGIYPYAQEPLFFPWERYLPCSLTWGNGLASIVILGVTGVILFPVFAQSGSNCGGAPSCASNLKQMSVSATMYSADYDDKIVPSNSWIEATLPYMKSLDWFKCPDTTSEVRYGYAADSRLGGLKIDDLADPAHQVWIYDSSSNRWNANDPLTSLRPKTDKVKPRAAFLDGHVAFVRQMDMWISGKLGGH